MQGEGQDGVQALVEAKGLVQISDPAALRDIVDVVLAANPKQLAQYRNGKTKLQGYFVGYGFRLYITLSFVSLFPKVPPKLQLCSQEMGSVSLSRMPC